MAKDNRKGDLFMRKLCITIVLLAALFAAGSVFADENFGVVPPVKNATTEQPGPTIAQDLTKEGFVPLGQDGTPIPMTVRGFDPGNGADQTFGALKPMVAPK
jgi:hypothetical protein